MWICVFTPVYEILKLLYELYVVVWENNDKFDEPLTGLNINFAVIFDCNKIHLIK